MSELSPYLRQRMAVLQETRDTLLAQLQAPIPPERLVRLRRFADLLATRTDALIAAMRTTRCGVRSGQLREAEELRAVFRLAVGHLAALLEAALAAGDRPPAPIRSGLRRPEADPPKQVPRRATSQEEGVMQRGAPPRQPDKAHLPFATPLHGALPQ